MYEFEFEGYTKEQCDLYLERIEAEFDGKADLENLNHLIVCHQRTVPFENLAMSENWGSIDLDPEALFKKVVTDRRGGFCFELNGAFLLLLKGLGYDAFGVMARIGVPFVGKLLPLHHRGIVVALDGTEYYLDVGLGGPKPECAIPFTGEKKTANGKTYWIEETERGWKMLRNANQGEDSSCVIFAPIAMLPFDFKGNCMNLIAAGDTIFHKNRIVNINADEGFTSIENNTITIETQGGKIEREYSEEEFPALLKQYFGIDYPNA